MIIFDNYYFDVHFSIINAIAVVTHESDTTNIQAESKLHVS